MEYSLDFSLELARNSSAASHRRFSKSVVLAGIDRHQITKSIDYRIVCVCDNSVNYEFEQKPARWWHLTQKKGDVRQRVYLSCALWVSSTKAAIALQWKHISDKYITLEQAITISTKGLTLKDGLKTQSQRRFLINHQQPEI